MARKYKKREYKRSAIDRFMDSVLPEPNSGCWLWLGGYNHANEYGHSRILGFATTSHRVSWILHRGQLPDGMQIDHVCRNRCCVNPDHLRVVTKAENLAHRTRQRLKCWRGHLIHGDNVIVEKSGARRCRICRERYRGAAA